MNSHSKDFFNQRGDEFCERVGRALKGKITQQCWKVPEIARLTGHSEAAIYNWLNGKTKLPMSVLIKICEIIEIEPQQVIHEAYNLLIKECGNCQKIPN